LACKAILFIIFNRPATTRQVFEAIRNAKPPRLFIAADAPRVGKADDIEKCKAAKAITDNIDWPCEVKRLFRDENFGCGIAVSEAINWFFTHETEGIILEDDCLPHPDFFKFTSAMLEHFRENHRVVSINGSNLGYHPANTYNYSYSRYMNMWGWATWRDRAMQIDYQMNEWKAIKNKTWWVYNHAKQYLTDSDVNWYRLWRDKFNKVAIDPNFTWDWQWMYHQLKNRQLSVVPSSNLISNIGFDADATHTCETENPAANIPTAALPMPLQHPAQMKPDYLYEEQYVKWVWCYHKRLPMIFYIKQFISQLIGR
jgi:hypothetical protein